MQRDTVNIFKALSDPNRIRILKMLERKELCVCEIREVLDISVSTVSKHLTILRNAGLIVDSKDGKWVNFRRNDSTDSPVVRSMLKVMRESFESDDVILADRKNVRKANRKIICRG